MDDLAWAEHGDTRVGARRRPNSDVIDIVVTQKMGGKAHRIIFEGPDLVVTPMEEAVSIDWEDESMLSYALAVEDSITDMFFALAKLFGMSTDADEAYRRGRLEGENNVLWHIAKHTLAPPPTVRPANPNVVSFPSQPQYISTPTTFSG